jgi:hypothetical protein
VSGYEWFDLEAEGLIESLDEIRRRETTGLFCNQGKENKRDIDVIS